MDENDIALFKFYISAGLIEFTKYLDFDETSLAYIVK